MLDESKKHGTMLKMHSSTYQKKHDTCISISQGSHIMQMCHLHAFVNVNLLRVHTKLYISWYIQCQLYKLQLFAREQGLQYTELSTFRVDRYNKNEKVLFIPVNHVFVRPLQPYFFPIKPEQLVNS